MPNTKPEEPLTIRVLRVLYRAKGLLTRAELMRRVRCDPATEITRPLRDLRKGHISWSKSLSPNLGVSFCRAVPLRLSVPCVKDAAGRPAYMLTESDRYVAARLLAVKP